MLLFHPKNSFIKHTERFNLDHITNEDNKDHNEKLPYIPDHPYRMLIIGSFGSGKRKASPNSIKEKNSGNLIDKIYLYTKGLSK